MVRIPKKRNVPMIPAITEDSKSLSSSVSKFPSIKKGCTAARSTAFPHFKNNYTLFLNRSRLHLG